MCVSTSSATARDKPVNNDNGARQSPAANITYPGSERSTEPGS
jgi:hypothetical protein